jgi:hypothetical protein
MPRKRVNPERDRFELRIDPEWIAWVDEAASQIGLSASAYIRMVVTQRMVQDGVKKPSLNSSRSRRRAHHV